MVTCKGHLEGLGGGGGSGWARVGGGIHSRKRWAALMRGLGGHFRKWTVCVCVCVCVCERVCVCADGGQRILLSTWKSSKELLCLPPFFPPTLFSCYFLPCLSHSGPPMCPSVCRDEQEAEELQEGRWSVRSELTTFHRCIFCHSNFRNPSSTSQLFELQRLSSLKQTSVDKCEVGDTIKFLITEVV